MVAQEQSEKERLFDKIVEFVNSLDDYAKQPILVVFLTDIERSFAEWLFQDRQQAIDQAVVEAREEELANVQRELNKAEIAGTVKWYVEDRIRQLHEQEKSA